MSPSPTPVKALTTQASNSMQAELEREKDRLKLLLEMTNTLVSNLEFRDLLRAISASIRRVMQCDSVGVWLPDSKQGQLRAHALEFPESKGFAKEDLLQPFEGSLIGSVFKTGKPLVVDKTDLMSKQANPEARAEGLGSGCALPLISRNRTLGVLTLGSRAENSFSPEDIDFLVRAAGQVAIAIENANLYSDLQRSEAFLARGQSISQTGSFGWSVLSGEIYWSEETYNIYQHDRAVKPTLELVFRRIHPDDRDRVQQALDHATNEKTDFDIEHRLLMPDGSVKHVHVLARALETSSGKLEYVGAVTDVTAAKQAEQTLRESEAYLAEAQRLSYTGSWAWAPETGELRYWSEECYRVLGFDPHGGQPRFETFFQRIHPDDQAKVRETAETAGREKAEFELDYRIVHPGGEVRDIHVVGHPVLSPSSDLVEFVGTVIDITERKRSEEERKQAEDKIRRSEMEFRQILDCAPQYVAVLGPDRDRTRLYANQTMLDYFGFTLEEWRSTDRHKYYHPDDWERLTSETESKFLSGLPHEYEARFRRKDGKYRWFLYRW